MMTVAAMDVRRRLGELLDLVRLRKEVVVIERAGKPVARLCPASEEGRAGTRERLDALDRLCGLGGVTARGKAPEAWLARERDGWEGKA